jgi:hypothetical protein
MIHLCMEKNVALCKFIFELVSDFQPNFGPKFGPKSCTHYIADKFDKSQKRILFLKSPLF